VCDRSPVGPWMVLAASGRANAHLRCLSCLTLTYLWGAGKAISVCSVIIFTIFVIFLVLTTPITVLPLPLFFLIISI
jgi:hypothetical protein